MDPYIISLFYRVFLILVGIFYIYLGYRLFSRGIAIDAGELRAKFKNTSFMIRNAAPGTFLFVLGTIVIIIGGTSTFQINDATFTIPDAKHEIVLKRENMPGMSDTKSDESKKDTTNVSGE